MNRSRSSLGILVVEDCETDIELYGRLLEKDPLFEYRCYCTADKSEAMEILSKQQIDCVLIDYKLPGYTGLELLAAIQSRYAERTPAAIILTGGSSAEIAWKSIEAGAKEYLAKDNLNSDSLRLGIRTAIRQSTHERSMREKQRDLELALAEAERATSAKSVFLANMSHEIRTPLNGIIGFIELALGEPSPNACRDHLHFAHESAKHLQVLIDDTLDLSKIEAGKLFLERRQLSIRALVAEAMNICGFSARAKHHALNCAIADDVPDGVVSDSVRIKQVILNLLSNAIKFTAENGIISVAVHCQERSGDSVTIAFSVTDNGIGIPKDKQQQIFSPFTQGDSSTTRKFGGTGLGLSICAHLVEMMGGHIWIESDVGRGSTFHFTIQAPLHAAEENIPAEATPVAQAAPSRSLSILVAEDNALNQTLIRAVLGKAGHVVTIAENGVEALSSRFSAPFDLILMDIQMPEMDGFEATRRIRTQELEQRVSRIPIVALTAAMVDGDFDKYAQAGMDASLTKPIERSKLVSTIRSLFPSDE